MPAQQQINPEIWNFWTQTQKAWASGALNSLGHEYQTAANSVMKVEQFADTTPALVTALREIRAADDEYLISWSDDADVVLTNKRFMVRRCKGGAHDIHLLSDIRHYSEDGWWTKTITVRTRDGRTTTYKELGSSLQPAILNLVISQLPKATFNPPNRGQPADHIDVIDQVPTQQQQQENEMPDEEMIGAAYPALQQLIKNRLQPGEKLVAFTTASTKIGGSGAAWIPFVGTTLELARSLTVKPYLLAVTDQRLLIIQINRYSRITKEIKEVSFDEVPLKQIRTAAASKLFSFIYSKLDGESLKVEVGDGRKYTFRNISSENAAMIRDAILGNQS